MPFRDAALGIDLNFEAVEGLIGDRGDPVIHEISVPCTCLTLGDDQGATGHANPNCPECRGRGYMYRDPVQIVGLLTGFGSSQSWVIAGWVQPGDISFTPSTYAREISNFDRVTLCHPYPVEGQVIVRGQHAAFSPRPSDLNADEDLLYWESGDEEAMWLEDEDKVRYYPGQYELDGRRIKWIGGFGPPVGKKYAIRYRAFVEFLCWTGPTQIWDNKRDVGQRVMLRRAVVESNPGNNQIKPPWIERVEGEFRGYEEPYELTDAHFDRTLNPSR